MSNVVPIRPPPAPAQTREDELWACLIGGRTPLQAARFLARWLRTRSPVGVSSWTHAQVRAHYYPVMLAYRKPATPLVDKPRVRRPGWGDD